MEILLREEAWVEKDGEYEFSHTKVVFQEVNGTRYFYSTTSQRYHVDSDVVISDLELIEIPTSIIWPLCPSNLTRAPDPLPLGCYLKKPSLRHYGDSEASSNNFSDLVLQEVLVCEILRTSPHPNVAKYHGCVVEGKRISGLLFTKYGMSLSERVRKGDPLDVTRCLDDIWHGLRHLHGLGLVHCDVNPANIMMDGDTSVIIDFDSCRKVGEQLGPKAGTEGWTKEDFMVANVENDFYGFYKIAEFLRSNSISLGSSGTVGDA